MSAPVQEAITTMVDAATVQSIADDVWTSLVGDGEVLVPLPVPATEVTVSAWVQITGPWCGAVVVTCEEATAVALTECLLRARPPAVIEPEDVDDALGELANVLGGNVKSLLREPSSLGLPQTGPIPPAFRPDDLCRVDAQWRGQSLTIIVQGAIGTPHTERNEVPQ
ncbi:Chemotaxis phosphatase CheX [Modestobacter sp. DSM 44400]|uniref:chemotaxis protein CheX n=1 Tax=Modestobacter sp. DSM 44400 TaxID=1550230 RepID=UPI000896A0DC|nr:chemotaxis protein CheX [Modestobacter sp. DSM 44400]SDY68342.1 Chemotaxis phosphatase CheX [Modestobacter sp. DSM 44400]